VSSKYTGSIARSGTNESMTSADEEACSSAFNSSGSWGHRCGERCSGGPRFFTRRVWALRRRFGPDPPAHAILRRRWGRTGAGQGFRLYWVAAGLSDACTSALARLKSSSAFWSVAPSRRAFSIVGSSFLTPPVVKSFVRYVRMSFMLLMKGL
jgi:hypothetical protein